MSDIWSELPYVVSTGWWWILFPLCLLLIPWGFFVKSHQEFSFSSKDKVLCAVACFIDLLVIVGFVAACVSYDATHQYDGRHEWRGGAGPDTECNYQIRQEFVGVVGKGGHYEDHTYTVCLDKTGG